MRLPVAATSREYPATATRVGGRKVRPVWKTGGYLGSGGGGTMPVASGQLPS